MGARSPGASASADKEGQGGGKGGLRKALRGQRGEGFANLTNGVNSAVKRLKWADQSVGT